LRIEDLGLRIEDKLELSNDMLRKIDEFTKYLMDWNKVHNLTGAKRYEEIEEQVYDSIYPLAFLTKYNSLLDIGTGAGFPGMLLAIAMPDTECTLCEPLRKRASFLKFIARELQLANVTVEVNRVENLEIKPYDLITSRAVTDTKTLIEWSRPFIGENTQMLFYKGEQVFKEMKDLGFMMKDGEWKIISRGKRNYLWIQKLGFSEL